MASSTSSAAVAALVQKASQQYLDCRRKVTAKVEEVKALDQEINALFSQITALGESAGASGASKSVGRLEVRIAGVEGEKPVENAVITVALDPEYEADEDAFEYVEVQHVVEKHTVTVTAVTADGEEEVVAEKVITIEDGVETGVEVIKEDAGSSGEEGEAHAHAHVKRKTTTKVARTVQTKKIKQKAEKKEPPVRSVEWTPEAESAAFPATFVFDPVQSREAVVTITVAAAKDDAEPEAEPVKEIEFPVSSLFQGKDLDQWYTVGEEPAAAEAAADAEEVEAEAEAAVESAADEEKAEEEAVEAEADAEAEKEEAPAAIEAEKTEEDEAPAAVEAEEETAAAATEEEAAVESTEDAAAEPAEDAVAAVEQTEEAAKGEESSSSAEKAAVSSGATRFHVQATFVLSEIEALSLEAVTLSKKKQEAEAVLAILEREAASLRTKYERLMSSQRSLGASSVSKPKSSLLLGGRTFGQPAPPKSGYQKLKDSVSAVLTPQRQQVAISVIMFFGSAALFHFQGENLLA